MLISKNTKDKWIFVIIILWLIVIFTNIFFSKWILVVIGFVFFFSTIFLENWLNDRFLEAGIVFEDEESCSTKIEI